MGDRCYVELRCRKAHAPVFEKLGFTVREENWEGNRDLVELVEEEANYGHYGQMPRDIPYFGWHGEGGEYGAEAFACDGREYLEVAMDVHSGEMVVRVNAQGRPDKRELAFVAKFLALEKRAKRALGLARRKEKRRGRRT